MRFVTWLLGVFFFNPSVYGAVTLEVGYLPVLPMSQLFVIEGEGWSKKEGIRLNLQRFADAPTLMKALTAGKLDVAYVGISPLLVGRSKGLDVHVVASNIVEQAAFLARGELTQYMVRDAKAGIERFTQRKGHRPRIATFPKGSVPDTVLRHWLLNVARLRVDSIDIIPMTTDQLQQALLEKTVDGASLLEPTLTSVLLKDRSAKVVVTGVEMMTNMPGAVVAVSGALVRNQPGVVQKLVTLHHRATEFLIRRPEAAAVHIHAVLGNGVSLDAIERAITSPHTKFVSDPYRILSSTKSIHDFQLELGELKSPVDLDKLYETRFYRKLAGG